MLPASEAPAWPGPLPPRAPSAFPPFRAADRTCRFGREMPLLLGRAFLPHRLQLVRGKKAVRGKVQVVAFAGERADGFFRGFFLAQRLGLPGPDVFRERIVDRQELGTRVRQV